MKITPKHRERTEEELSITNHTNTFMQMRQECQHEVNLPVEREMPLWVQIKQDSETQMKSMKAEMKELREIMDTPPSVLDTFNTKNDIDFRCTKLTAQIDSLYKLVTELDKQTDISNEQISICKNLRINLCTKLTVMLNEFRAMQSYYSKVVEGPIVQGEENEEDIPNHQMIENDPVFDTIRDEGEAANLRGIEYQKIHKMVYELKNLFTQLSDMVIEQGSLMDRIDQNLVTATLDIDKGRENIVKAITYGKSNLICWIGLLVIIVIFSVIVIVVIRLRRG